MNNEIINLSKDRQIFNPEVRNRILDIEEKVKQLPNAMIGDCFPLKHIFVDGAYVREITMPKGALVVSKIHKKTHPYFILKGEVSVLTEDGVVRLKAPYSGITLAGTKRVLYIHEETIWTTIHVTGETDLEKIEKEIIAETFDEIDSIPEYAIEFLNREENSILCLG
ncbi:MAG: hypothetical protein WA066_02995 [Candidatus Omnitrophota bacterium]